jgi:hypothetical protein
MQVLRTMMTLEPSRKRRPLGSRKWHFWSQAIFWQWTLVCIKKKVALERYLSVDGLVVPIALPIIQSCIRAIIKHKIYVLVFEIRFIRARALWLLGPYNKSLRSCQIQDSPCLFHKGNHSMWKRKRNYFGYGDPRNDDNHGTLHLHRMV